MATEVSGHSKSATKHQHHHDRAKGHEPEARTLPGERGDAARHGALESKAFSKNLPAKGRKGIPTLWIFAAIVVVALVLGGAYLAFVPKGPATKAGDRVYVYYVGRTDDGKVFDTNVAAEAKKAGTFDSGAAYAPLSFTLGAGEMIPGFDKAVAGMRVGEKRIVRILPEDAYGYPQESLVVNVTIARTAAILLSNFDEQGVAKAVGTEVPTRFGSAKVIAVNATHGTIEFSPKADETIAFPNGARGKMVSSEPSGENGLILTIDANHPLAGQPLTFDVTLASIGDAPAAASSA